MVEERETIITDTRRGGGGAGVVAVVAILLLLVVLFLVFGRGLLSGSDTKTVKADVDISAPKTGG